MAGSEPTPPSAAEGAAAGWANNAAAGTGAGNVTIAAPEGQHPQLATATNAAGSGGGSSKTVTILAPQGPSPAAAGSADAAKAAGLPQTQTKRPKKTPGWTDVAWHSTAAMLGAGVVGLSYVFSCLGWAGGVVLLCLAILVSRDSYLCLVRCYEIDGDDFFERRWRHRRERAARRVFRAKIARQLACGADAAVGTRATVTDATKTTTTPNTLDRAPSDMSGPGGPDDPIAMALDEDELDTDAPQRVKDAVTLVDAQTGEEVDLLTAEADYCRRRALMRGKQASADALEAGGNVRATSSAYIPPERPTLALFHEYPALSRWAFGRRLGTLLLTPFQVALIVGICISYNIVGAEALYSIVASSRALAQTAASATATAALSALPKAPFYIAFAAAQALLAVACGSIAESGAVSLGGVVASVVYCGIASALSLAIVAWRNANPSLAPPLSHAPSDALYNPAGPGTGPRAPGGPTLGAAFTALNAVAMFLFTMGGHNIALETQAVLPVPPPSTIPAMTKGVNVAFLITALACFWTGLTGYSAFGSFVGENILSTISAAAVGATAGGASTTNPLATWPAASIVAVRVACIVAEFAIFAHVLAAYNVYAQTLWVGAERRLSRRWKDWRACAEEAKKKKQQQGNNNKQAGSAPPPPPPPPPPTRRRRWSLSPSTTEALARAPLRLLYVVAVLAVAVSVPFFGPVAGVVGAFCITPTTFVLPYALEVLRHRTYDRTDDGLKKASGSTLPAWRVAACWVAGVGASAVGLAGTAASVYIILAQLRAKHS